MPFKFERTILHEKNTNTFSYLTDRMMLDLIYFAVVFFGEDATHKHHNCMNEQRTAFQGIYVIL